MASEVKEKNIRKKYIRQLILHFIEKYTICGLSGLINNEILKISTLEGCSLYLENLDYSFQKVIFSIVLKYNEQLQKNLCDNPNLHEVYLLNPISNNCSFNVYKNKEIIVLTPLLYAKDCSEDIKIQLPIQIFLDNFLALPCEELIVGEHFWENTKGDKMPLHAWTLKKGDLLVYCDSNFYSYVENKIKEQEEQGIKLCRMLDGGEMYE